jgi:hypothetical protein
MHDVSLAHPCIFLRLPRANDSACRREARECLSIHRCNEFIANKGRLIAVSEPVAAEVVEHANKWECHQCDAEVLCLLHPYEGRYLGYALS